MPPIVKNVTAMHLHTTSYCITSSGTSWRGVRVIQWQSLHQLSRMWLQCISILPHTASPRVERHGMMLYNDTLLHQLSRMWLWCIWILPDIASPRVERHGMMLEYTMTLCHTQTDTRIQWCIWWSSRVERHGMMLSIQWHFASPIVKNVTTMHLHTTSYCITSSGTLWHDEYTMTLCHTQTDTRIPW